MKVPLAIGATIGLLVVCALAAATLLDVLNEGGEGFAWETLLRVGLLGVYILAPVLGVLGVVMIVRRVFDL